MKWIKTYESVSSQKYLEKLTIDILKSMSERTMNSIIKHGEVQYIYMISGTFLPNLDLSKYDDEMKKFILDTKISVVPEKNMKGSMKGSITQGSFSRAGSIIYLNVDESLIEEINENLNNPKQYGEHILHLNASDLYFKFWYAFNSTLLHELQHVWDSWKSKGKYTNSKKWYKYKNDVVKYNKEETQDNENSDKIFNNYLKLNHEVNARFSQAIQQTQFWKTETKPPFNQYKKSFDDVKSEFILYFEGWKKMTPNIQKRLLQRLYNFWVSDYKKRDDKEESLDESKKKKKL